MVIYAVLSKIYDSKIIFLSAKPEAQEIQAKHSNNLPNPNLLMGQSEDREKNIWDYFSL